MTIEGAALEHDRFDRCRRSRDRFAYWYFRLNGFMTTENFLVHPEIGSNPRTDADILATRFAFREENNIQPMADDPQITECATYVNVIIAEITRSRCKLNGPWTDPGLENMERVLRAIGCIDDLRIHDAASALYSTGFWSSQMATIRLFAVGEWKNENLPISLDQQIEWTSIIDFCIRRFSDYRMQKSSNSQWCADGIDLRSLSLERNIDGIREYFDLRQT